MPQFSIIVPCFNAAAFLDETLSSLRDQTLTDWEAFLVDDGSTDSTPEILALWAAGDPRFQVLRLPNGGPSCARNHAALALAQADYIAFLDADDLWPDNKLSHSAALLHAHPEADGAFGIVSFFRETPSRREAVSRLHLGALSVQELLRGNPVCTTSNLVVRRSLMRRIGGFNPAMKFAEDLEWLMRAALNGACIIGDSVVHCHYRANGEGLSANLEDMHEGWRAMIAAAREHGLVLDGAERDAAEASHLRYLARRALRVRSASGTALRYALRGIAKSPSGFFESPARGGLTLLCACAEPLIPRGLRRIAFAA